MAENDSLGLEQQRHQALMRDVATRMHNASYILKGGTAILLTRNGPRHSVDLDFDADRKTDIGSRVSAAFKAQNIEILGTNVYKDTDTKQTIRYRYFDPVTQAIDTLKVETRIQPVDPSTVETINGIKTYRIETLFDQKLSALANRTASRDLKDITYLLSAYGDKLDLTQIERTATVLTSVDERLDDFAGQYETDYRVPGKRDDAINDALTAMVAVDRLRIDKLAPTALDIATERWITATQATAYNASLGLPALLTNAKSLADAATEMDTLRPGAVAALRSALRHDPEAREALTTAPSHQRGKALVTLLMREQTVTLDPNVRAERLVTDWHTAITSQTAANKTSDPASINTAISDLRTAARAIADDPEAVEVIRKRANELGIRDESSLGIALKSPSPGQSLLAGLNQPTRSITP
jgi:predicted nucleotidyltransferase component of viral defense system